MIVHIAIGNTDNKLSQEAWAAYCEEVSDACQLWHLTIHGSWFSLPNAPWQNACWALEVHPSARDSLRRDLVQIAARYWQDSIAWNESETEFLKAGVSG